MTGLWISAIDVYDAAGIQIKKNHVDYNIHFGYNTSGALLAENVVGFLNSSNSPGYGESTTISNNIIVVGDGNVPISGFRNSVIKNNTITSTYGGDPNMFFIRDNQGTAIINNIVDRRLFSNAEDIAANNTGSVATNNIQVLAAGSTVTAPPAGSNSVVSANPDNIFVIANPWEANPFRDDNFKLKAGSPALLIGSDGKDAGAFGGFSPYTLSGLPNIPIVTSAFSSGAGTNTTPLSVKISIRSN